jgi:uncharacterized membrane protein
LRARLGAAAGAVAVLLLILSAWWFVEYSAGLGWAGLTRDLWPESRFDRPDAPLSAAIFVHMIAGAAITALAPLQLLPVIRRRAPVLHRWFGRAIVAAALATGVAGLVWIAAEGTIGGAWMSVWFALYGVAMIVAAAQAVRFARAGAMGRHRDWALRLFVLAMGSWAYRIHYGLWWAATDGAATNDAFTGLFDRVNVVAFFVPYLLLLEAGLAWWRRREGGRRPPARPGRAPPRIFSAR